MKFRNGEYLYEHLDVINGHQVVVFAITQWIKLVKSGHAAGYYMPFESDESAFVAYHDSNPDHPIGVLVYNVDHKRSTACISLGAVHRDHRGNGVYKTLYSELKVKTQIRYNVRTIESFVHPDNNDMIEVSDKLGRYTAGFIVRHEID
jgi:GNAT superfamily N-acetyltransferase